MLSAGISGIEAGSTLLLCFDATLVNHWRGLLQQIEPYFDPVDGASKQTQQSVELVAISNRWLVNGLKLLTRLEILEEASSHEVPHVLSFPKKFKSFRFQLLFNWHICTLIIIRELSRLSVVRPLDKPNVFQRTFSQTRLPTVHFLRFNARDKQNRGRFFRSYSCGSSPMPF